MLQYSLYLEMVVPISSILGLLILYAVQLSLNFTHACRHMRVLARLTHVKLQKLACARTAACNFGACTRASEHTRHTRNARHELALRLPHYTSGVTTGTVAVGNEQLFCS